MTWDRALIRDSGLTGRQEGLLDGFTVGWHFHTHYNGSFGTLARSPVFLEDLKRAASSFLH